MGLKPSDSKSAYFSTLSCEPTYMGLKLHDAAAGTNKKVVASLPIWD